jgi:hypothetical protein
MYRGLTEFPSRTPGCVVPLSTLTFELDGGQLVAPGRRLGSGRGGNRPTSHGIKHATRCR